MKKLFYYGLIITMVIAIPFASGCRKNDPVVKDDSDTQAAEDQSLAESLFDNLKSISDEASEGDLSTYKNGGFSSAPCAVVSRDTVSSPRQIIIDFGTVNCLCKDGRYRRGVITVSYTGRYRDSGTVITITPTNYYVNEHKLSGSKSITNKGLNAQGNLNYGISVNGQIDKPNSGGTITWQSTRNNEWAQGSNTILNWLDDVYLITGTASGSNSKNVSWTASITTPLRVQIGCRWITSGVFDLNITGLAKRTIDYGTGACDAQASVTINGKTYPITLR